MVVSLQNGLNERVIARIVGEARTMGAFVNFGADYMEPGRVLYAGRGACVLGELDGALSPRLKALAELMATFEPNVVTTDNIWGYLWGKLGYGALLFATALTDDSIADVLAMPKYRPLLTALAREVMGTAAALKITPEGFNGFDPLAFGPDATAGAGDASMDAMVAFNRRSAKSHSGIWRDLAVRKRKTEVDAQLGPIVEEAERLGRTAPITAALIGLIHDIEDGRQPLALTTLDRLGKAAPKGTR
jgi:2-dehydropantoate 2-reductase